MDVIQVRFVNIDQIQMQIEEGENRTYSYTKMKSFVG